MHKPKKMSPRVDQIKPSGIREIFDLACNNPQGIDLSIGEPDFDIPDLIKQEGIYWINQGFNHYVSTKGIEELREALRVHLNARRIHFDDLLVTAGATGAYYLAVLSLVGPGDEVLITDPYFVAYANVVIMCGGTPKLINTYPDFRLRAEEIEPLISERTRALVINHPNNPTGMTYSLEELQMVKQIADDYGLQVISDEIYDQFVYGEGDFVSMGNVAEDAVVISGFSKSAGMTGWRLGYVSGPKRVIDAMATFQQYSYVCANSIAQKAAVRSLKHDIKPYVELYHRRMQRVYEGLKERFQIVKPGGAFFLFPRAPGDSADDFVKKAIEKNVYIIPGKVFSQRNTHFRLSFAADEQKLKNAVDILNRLAEDT
ncbi:MAG: pyridoxal phosphate-dependent aminotransferase [bacterium]